MRDKNAGANGGIPAQITARRGAGNTTAIFPISFTELQNLSGGRIGHTDSVCPFCSSGRTPRNRNKKVARIWNDGDFVSLNCVHCGAKAWAKAGGVDRAIISRPEVIARAKAEHAKSEADYHAQQLGKARWLYSAAVPVTGTIAERYLREARGIKCEIPATLRFLKPRKPEHHPAMVSPFGIASEPEPGIISIDPAKVASVHLTFLKPDGSGKAEAEEPKITVGQSQGQPIVIAHPSDSLGLAVAEGTEDALSAHEATGLGAWAAGSGGRMPALADAIPGYIEAVTILAHPDKTGMQGATELAEILRNRGVEIRMHISKGSE